MSWTLIYIVWWTMGSSAMQPDHIDGFKSEDSCLQALQEVKKVMSSFPRNMLGVCIAKP